MQGGPHTFKLLAQRWSSNEADISRMCR